MEFVKEYNFIAPPTLPNEPVEFEKYIAPKSVEVSTSVQLPIPITDLESVEIVVDLPKTQVIDTFNYVPVKSDYVPIINNVNLPVSTEEYVAPKNVFVSPVVNLVQDVPDTVQVEEFSVQQEPITSINGIQPNITFAGQTPLFLLAGASGLGKDWYNYPSQSQVDFNSYGITGLGNVYMTGGITGVGDISMNDANITGCQSIAIDNQVLTADSTDLLLNGTAIATINNLPNIEEWANYSSINTIVMNAEGVSGAPFGITGSKYYGFNAGSTLTATADTLLFNGSAIGGTGYTGVSLWSAYPMIHNIIGNNYSISGISGISGNSAVFNTISGITGNFTNVNTTNINGSPYVPTTAWSTEPAVSQVVLAGNSIASGGGNNIELDADQKVIINTTRSDIDITAGQSVAEERAYINLDAGSVNLTGNQGDFVLVPSEIVVKAEGGQYGHVVIEADGSDITGSNGLLEITANGGVVGSSGIGSGGLVKITANSPQLKTLPSAVRINASCCSLYSGALNTRTSVYGYTYIWGEGAVSIVSSLLPPPVSPSPLTVYLEGSNGVVVGSEMYVYRTIQPYYNGISAPYPLTILGRTIGGVDYPVYFEIVGGIIFSDQTVAQILRCKTFTGNNTNMTGISNLQTVNTEITGTANVNVVSTNTINATTSNSLTLSGVSAISGNAIVINSGSGTITIEGAETDITSTNTYITNAEVETLTATTINGVNGTIVVAPCKFLTGTFGAVGLTIAPIVVYQSGNLTWNWNGIAGLGTSTSITVGVDTIGSYAFAMAFLVGSTPYFLNTYTLDSPFVMNSNAYNGVDVVSATLNDSFNNTISNGTTYKIIVYMWCGSVSTANTTGAKLNFNIVSAQSL